MSKKNFKYLILLSLFICGISLFSVTTGRIDPVIPEVTIEQALPQDTGTIYPVRKTQITNYEDLIQKTPVDLKDPSNVKTEVEYDVKNNIYLFRTKIDEGEWVTPFTLNPQQYMDYSLKESMSEYFREKNAIAYGMKDKKEEFSLKDIKVNLGSLDRIFGPGGVRLKTQGYTEVSAGIKHTSTANPTISQRNRSRTMFDFQQKIQMNVDASVGEKVNFGLNYDTQATFDFDTKRVKLAYEGKEDEIIKYLGAGNVSLNTTNSLISGGASLFGIRSDLQFGKLRVNSVISIQESQTQSVGSKGGVQTTNFQFDAAKYDENQHFFLMQYFRDKFERGMSKLPFVQSPILITRAELWVTNKRGNFDKPRNIVAFADIGEPDSIKNKNGKWADIPGVDNPDNGANNLYSEVNKNYSAVRDIGNVTTVFTTAGLVSGQDYEKLESSRLLDANEYTLNTQLGFVSLKSALADDEVLAVAFEYTMNGQAYKVGEFASEIPNKVDQATKSGALFVKLIKPVSLSPNSYSWDLMMKNVYRLPDRQIQKDKFRLNITYLSDTTGTYINYLPAGAIKNEMLLRVMNLDRLDAQGNQRPDGMFDFLSGFTVIPETGRIIFPAVEPFGKYLRKKINDDAIADKFVYQQLYDSTQFVAEQITDRNKFRISGSYRASSSSSVISLNAMNVARGSVVVTANGIALVENADYTVDYAGGTVTILNQSLIDAGTPINVTLENQSLYSQQRKTLVGMNLSYEFTKDFTVGGTIMHMSEQPLTMKTGIGEEAISNTLWGLNTSYRAQSQWLTNLVDKLPFLTATAPSQISLNAEFAHMIGGHYKNRYLDGYSYLDDFESAKSSISLNNPYAWKLASTPSMFPESHKTDSIEYGNNRAHLAWYTIDNLFTRKNSSLKPGNITVDDLSDHRVREVQQREIYPNRDILANEPALISTFNLTYYPDERGMYNLDATNISPEGKLLNPEKRWGGITRKIDNRDFESTNIEYIQFWLMDPFVYNDRDAVKNDGGDLYFDLGDVSEDVLKDGKKFYENGLPLNGDTTAFTKNVWGKVPNRQSTVYAFDISQGAASIAIQDVGLNGLSKAEEAQFPTYANYLTAFRAKLSATTEAQMLQDPFSPLNDLSGDKFHHYRGADYDREGKSILDRYKYFNGTEGNSASGDSSDSFSSAASANPDVEDLDTDNTMSETERYFQYKVSLRPADMKIGGYITDMQTVPVELRNGQSTNITWYQFKIPIHTSQKETIGNIKDFTSIRFMRMFLTDFKQATYLRFGTLDLVRGDWRVYTQTLEDGLNRGTGSLNISAVNIEENSERKPVSYVTPPGITRIPDPNQAQVRQENEQSLSLQVVQLDPQDARAVFKPIHYDLRRYKRLQMFTHAEELVGGPDVSTGEVTAFLRLGSDYNSNYYEYEIPLQITPAGQYNTKNSADQEIVWPSNNMFDFPLEILKDLKLKRNKEKRQAGSTVSYTKVYSDYDPYKAGNKISVIGNPSLSEINVVMIGIRNNSRTVKSAEVWVNELRMTDYDDENGWAAQGNLNIALSDVGTVSFSGRKETAGFGSIDQNLIERRLDDFYSYNIATTVDLGRFLPEKAKVSVPLYYSYSNQTTTPKYDPLDQDVTLKEALSVVETKAEKDSIRSLAQDQTTTKNLSLTNMKVNIQSKTPMPYDPANFTFGYAYSQTELKNPTTVSDQTNNYKASVNYTYSPTLKPWAPFKDMKSKAPLAKYPKSLAIGYLPNNISFNSYMTGLYTETLIRDLEGYTLGSGGSTNASLFLTGSRNFYWDRDFSMNWDLLHNLKISVQTGTRAEVQEPYLQVNKPINRDEYDSWKDDVMRGIRSLGNPLGYRQTAKVTYVLPLNNIPFLDWISSSANYDSGYTWDRGAVIDSTTEIGNTITNNMTLTLNNRIDLTSLYNKSSYLRKVNEKFDMNRRRQAAAPRERRPSEPKKKRFEQEVVLNTDSATTLFHGMNSKNIEVTAKRGSKTFKLKYKRIDANNIRISTKDTAHIKINIVEKGGSSEESTLYKVGEYAARGLMSVRTISLNYSTRDETAIGGFRPGVGDVFGQQNTGYGMVPGVGFAFGLDGGEEFINKSLRNDWLVLNDMSISPAVVNDIQKFDFEAQIEPIRGLKIRLNGLHEQNNRTTFQFGSRANLQKLYGGSFSMSTIALASSFENSNVGNNYASASFNKFLENRDVLVDRLTKKYTGVKYPNVGFIPGTGHGSGDSFDPKTSAINPNSPDVLIPAFLAAYTGKDANNIALTAFPALMSMLPNWRINYDGLTTLPWFKDKFKSFILSHAYTAQYSVGSYTSFLTWVDAGNNMGFIKSLDNTPLPSSAYDISSVNLIEQFNPLIGAEGTMLNNLTLKARYNYSRMLNLSITSFQIVETSQKDFVLGGGYRINEFNRLIGLPVKKGSAFNNDLNVTADISRRTTQSLIRRIDERFTEATSGTSILTLKLSAEYTLSRALLLRAFFDRVVNSPLISSTAYPTSNTNFGLSLRFTLTDQ